MRTTHTHIAAPTYRGRRKFVGSLLLLLLVAFSFWGGTSGNAARNWFARPGNASAAVASPTVTATLFATITVNTTADDNTVNGNCTLREAIIAANTNAAVDACTAGAAGGDNIVFNLGAGTPSIAVTGSALPDITEPVVIDGATGGATRVELNGAGAGAVSGLTITGGGSTIKALVINRFFDGIKLSGAGGNAIVNCYIGTNAAGTAALGNLSNGVNIESANNTVGGTTASERNLISGNGSGVLLSDIGATGNKIIGNYIGTDVTGTIALANGDGIDLGGADNFVGGTTVGERNIISGNDFVGIFIYEGAGHKISGNYIGTNVTGTAALSNGLYGIQIFAANNTIGGTTVAERNLISGNTQVGIFVGRTGSTNNKIIGNFIGTDVTGTVAIGNQGGGVQIQTQNNSVGGTTEAERNLISGNLFGLFLAQPTANGNKISGNYIGTDVTGTKPLGNDLVGVALDGPNNIVGGTTAGERNLISGNNGDGVAILDDFFPRGSGNKVIGNYIGTDVTGTKALSNGGVGVFMESPNNIVGGSTPGERNIISGNTDWGVIITNTGAAGSATGNKITGNYIGTDVTGNAALGNGIDGVSFQAPNNILGGPTVGERNIISGNVRRGVGIVGAIATGNRVIGNFIGTNAAGVTVLSNGQDGVNIQSNNNTVGGTTAAEANLIVGSGRNGVFIAVATATGNKVLGNSIFNNTALGIDLFPLGLSANDAGDADTGANKLQNFPVLTGLTNTTITGTLDSLPANTSYPVRLEFFANTAADASGNGEGEVFLGATSVAAPGAFNFNYTPVAGKPFITATATDNAGNTSEFSSALTGAPTVAITDPFSCSGPGNALTVRVAISNPAASTQTVSFTAALPAGLVGVPGSGTSSVGTAPTVTATSATFTATLTAGQTANVTYQVQVGDTVASGTQLCITTTSTVGAAQGPAVQTCATVNCPSVGPGTLGASNSPLSDQRAGSVLIYNIYTSSTDPTRQNTRISLTNTNPTRSISVHLFFVDGASCAIADSYICLTANQTASFLASDLDPGATGYLVAVATDAGGCPLNFNYLIGDEYVKFSSGHAANLAAEAISAVAGGLPLCDTNSTTATLAFDGVSYSVVPRVLALDNVASRADGNDTMLIVNRLGGNLGTGAATLGTLFGILYDDAENGLSFSLTGTCQLRNSLSNTFPRTAPRFENFIPAGRSGWLKLFSQSDIGISGAVINFNPNAITSAGAFNQGHNLHVLTTTNTAVYTIPVFPPGC